MKKIKLITAGFTTILCLLFIGCASNGKVEPQVPVTSPEPVETQDIAEPSDLLDSYDLFWSKDFDDADKTNFENRRWDVSDYNDGNTPDSYTHKWAKENVQIKDGNLCLSTSIDTSKKLIKASQVVIHERLPIANSLWEFKFKLNKGEDWLKIILDLPNEMTSNGYKNSIRLRYIEAMFFATPSRFFESSVNWNDAESGRWWFSPEFDFEKADFLCSQNNLFEDTLGDDWFNDWHVLKYVWGEDVITIYLDGKQLASFAKNSFLKDCDNNPAFEVELQISSDFEDNDNVEKADKSNTQYIDYIKVYTKKPE